LPPPPSQILFHQGRFAREIFKEEDVLWDGEQTTSPTKSKRKKNKNKKGGANQVGDAASADISVPTEEIDKVGT